MYLFNLSHLICRPVESITAAGFARNLCDTGTSTRINKLEEAKRDAELARLYGEKGEIAFGSQIRSYVLDDRRVKDHRNGYEVFQPDRVLDGEVQPFIDAQLRYQAQQRKLQAAAGRGEA